MTDHVVKNRVRLDENNLFLKCERAFSQQVIKSLDLYRDARDSCIENWFMAVYGASPLQALVGLRADAATARHRLARDVARQEVLAKSAADLEAHLQNGGLPEAGIRALVYVGLGQEFPSFDERGFAVLRTVRAHTPERERIPLAEFKRLVRDQYALIRADEDRAMSALPKLLPHDVAARRAAFDVIRRVVLARGEPGSEAKRRLARVEELFNLSDSAHTAVASTPRAPTRPSPNSATR